MGLGEVQRRHLDPVSGQAAYYGTVVEGEETPIVTVRIRVENGAITEGEWFVIDEGLIRRIYTAMFYPPPGLAVPNWPPYDGNWPLPAGIVPSNP